MSSRQRYFAQRPHRGRSTRPKTRDSRLAQKARYCKTRRAHPMGTPSEYEHLNYQREATLAAATYPGGRTLRINRHHSHPQIAHELHYSRKKTYSIPPTSFLLTPGSIPQLFMPTRQPIGGSRPKTELPTHAAECVFWRIDSTNQDKNKDAHGSQAKRLNERLGKLPKRRSQRPYHHTDPADARRFHHHMGPVKPPIDRGLSDSRPTGSH